MNCGLKKRRAGRGEGRGEGRAVTLPVVLMWAVTLWAVAGPAGALRRMTLQYTWSAFTFPFDNEEQVRQERGAGETFTSQNATPFDVDVDHTGRVFMSFPAILPGSPLALATIKERYKRDSPQLTPYPDWSWNNGQRGCDGLTSVFRIFIDKCRRLWVIDSGRVDIANTYEQKCPAQLLVFDLTTDKLITRHRFNVSDQYNETSLLLNVIAEHVGGSCSDAYAYVADSGSYGLYVFSLSSGRSWRVVSDAFLPDSNAGNFQVNGSSFMLEDGVLGLAQNDKELYFHSFSSFRERKVRKSVLRDESPSSGETNPTADAFQLIGSRVNQSAGEALAKNSVMFFHQMATESIYCWDTSTQYTRDNQHVVEEDKTLLHFVTSIKIITLGHNEDVWAIDNNGQRLFSGEFQPNLPYTVNIVRGSVSDLSSKCKGGWSSWFQNFCNFFWW